MAIAVPAEALAHAQAADRELWPLLLAIARYESSYYAGAIGDGGCSYGYLQFNRCGGLGDGHPVAELLDGGRNFVLGAAYIRGRLAAGASIWESLQPWSVRPQAYALYQQMLAEGVEGAGAMPRIGPLGLPLPDLQALPYLGLLVAVTGILLVAWVLD